MQTFVYMDLLTTRKERRYFLTIQFRSLHLETLPKSSNLKHDRWEYVKELRINQIMIVSNDQGGKKQ
jgi:hypothetical protein